MIKQRRMEKLELRIWVRFMTTEKIYMKIKLHQLSYKNNLAVPMSMFGISGCRKILMSYSASDPPRKPSTLVPATDDPICIVVGAIAKGMIETDYTEENISISNYPLSAALTCSKLCDAFEEAWGVF